MKIRNLAIVLATAVLSFLVLPMSAQDLLVYHVVSGAKNKVKYTDTGKEVQRNDKVTLATKITVQFDCMVEILDAKNNKRYTIQKPGSGTVKSLTASNGSVANLTQKYVAYVKAQMAHGGAKMRSPQQLYDYATVTRTVAKKSDSDNSFEAEFEEFSDDVNKEYNDFVRKIDEEYTDFVAKAWEEYNASPAVERPIEKQVKPETKPIKPSEINNDNAPVEEPKVEVVETPKEVVTPAKDTPKDDKAFFENQPKPIRPNKQDISPEVGDTPQEPVIAEEPKEELVNPKEPATPVYNYMPFTFYGTDMQVRLDETKRFNIGYALGSNGSFNPELVANVLRGLSSGEYDGLVQDCIAIRKKCKLGDWAYLQMLKTITDQFCGEGTNEASILMGYVYYKSGYRTRFAYNLQQKRIYMLFGSEYSIYNKPSYGLDGVSYYGVEELPQQLALCEAAYPDEKNLSLYTPASQKFADNEGEKRTIVSKRFPDVKITVSVNKNLVDYCGGVPASYINGDSETQWNTYANTPLDEKIQEQIYPVLKNLLDGKTETGKLNRLLDLIQNGMEYQYDDVVWGVPDRIFFAEESLFYPYCDCEDRAILFTRLVRDLVGLPCALVHYQGHLAAAVALNEEVPGVSWVVGGKKYTVCDPTYIGARCGEEMDCVDHNTAVLIKLP